MHKQSFYTLLRKVNTPYITGCLRPLHQNKSILSSFLSMGFKTKFYSSKLEFRSNSVEIFLKIFKAFSSLKLLINLLSFSSCDHIKTLRS